MLRSARAGTIFSLVSRAIFGVLLVAVNAGAAPPVKPPLAERGALRVVVVPDPTRPDFFSMVTGDRPGFEREILEGFARTRQLRLEVVTVKTWDEISQALRDDRADVVAGHCTDTEARRRSMDFTVGVLPTRTVVVTRRPHPVIVDAKALLAARLGAVKGSASHEDALAAGVPKAHIDDSLTQGNMLEMLTTGRVDGVVRAAPLAILSQRDDPGLQLGMFLGPSSSFAWGVQKGDAELLAALNEHLAIVRRTGTWSRLVVKYFGASALTILRPDERRADGQ